MTAIPWAVTVCKTPPFQREFWKSCPAAWRSGGGSWCEVHLSAPYLQDNSPATRGSPRVVNSALGHIIHSCVLWTAVRFDTMWNVSQWRLLCQLSAMGNVSYKMYLMLSLVLYMSRSCITTVLQLLLFLLYISYRVWWKDQVRKRTIRKWFLLSSPSTIRGWILRRRWYDSDDDTG